LGDVSILLSFKIKGDKAPRLHKQDRHTNDDFARAQKYLVVAIHTIRLHTQFNN